MVDMSLGGHCSPQHIIQVSYPGHMPVPGLPGSRNMGASTFANTSELPRSKTHTMGVPSKKRDVWKLDSQSFQVGRLFPTI